MKNKNVNKFDDKVHKFVSEDPTHLETKPKKKFYEELKK
jgi:hypothetical protein